MHIDIKKPAFSPVVITLTSVREVELLLALLLLANAKFTGDVNFIKMFRKHGECHLGKPLGSDAQIAYTRRFGILLATLNKVLRR